MSQAGKSGSYGITAEFYKQQSNKNSNGLRSDCNQFLDCNLYLDLLLQNQLSA